MDYVLTYAPNSKSHSAFLPVSLVFFCSHPLCGLLDNLDRIMERDYEPSDDDVAHVHSRTMPGLREYHFWPETGVSAIGSGCSHVVTCSSGKEAEHEWIFYDIGCSKTRVRIVVLFSFACSHKRQRATWLPYLMDVNTIVFCADISIFDQWLEGDPSVNRLEYSLNLWTTICKSKLIAKVLTPPPYSLNLQSC